MIQCIKNWILIRLIIRRFKKDATKYHSEPSKYSQALINCALENKAEPIIKNGFWYLGSVDKEFCKIRNSNVNVKSPDKWVQLTSWNKNLIFNEK